MVKAISREEEAKLPSFKSAEEAYRYFKERYKSGFRFQSVEALGDGQRYWHCHLVLNRRAYEEGVRMLAQRKAVTGLEFLQSYQTVELMESGYVHIVH